MEQLDEFIVNLLKEKGVTGLDPEVEKSLKEEMRTRLNGQINRSAIEQLSEDKAAELVEHLKDPKFTNEDFGKFMQDSGVDLVETTTNALLAFRSLYLGVEE